MKFRLLHIVLFFFVSLSGAVAQDGVSGRVVDASNGEPVVGAAVTRGSVWALTDSLGRFTLKAAAGELNITSLGYKTLKTEPLKSGLYRLQPDILSLQEVVVTAREERGVTASSSIGKEAIDHIQPSSVADLLELLPGGRAKDPVLSSPQVANLRSAASVTGNYATTALGTQVMIDGKPVGNDANLQSTPAFSNLGAESVNLGTDLRTIGTEDVESVDVVRGIASVEYGDLTSGLMKITRKKGGHDLRARFKSDMQSKLFYLGKDFEGGGADRWTANAGVSYLDSQADPRTPRQNYRRLTGTLRGGKTWNGNLRTTLNASLDYTGSFDDEKSDQDLDYGDFGPIETYKSTYHKLAAGLDLTLASRSDESLFRTWVTTGSLTYEKDLIDRWKHNTYGADQPLSVSTEPGEYDAVIIPARYDASLQVDGRPMYLFLSSVATFKKGDQRLKGGVQWTADKNFGEGYLFDPLLPFTAGMNTRPRAYKDIPAEHQISLFVEENGAWKPGRWMLEWSLGVRVGAMAGLGSDYALNLKPYPDPRANLRLEFPKTVLGGHRLDVGIYGGYGLHTKFPTMDMLFPDPVYGEIQQFNYWPAEKELRRINYLVYKVDASPYTLGPARNAKAEIGADFAWNGFSLAIDVFRENMTSGFRTASVYDRYIYKDYDESAVDKGSLTGPPSLEDLPYQTDTILLAHGVASNGSRTLKRGVEFTFSTPRISGINTRITANGAWFVTTNENSIPEYEVPSVLISGKRYPYAGYYESNDGTTYESLTTNIMLDTQIPSLGLVFSTSFQTVWYTDHQTADRDRYPLYYLDKELNRHDFTEADASDAILRYLIRDFATVNYSYRVPFAMNINLKATKKLYHDKVSCALFVNRLLNVTPDYEMNGGLVRRNVTPYFGMELGFKL